MGAKGWLRTVVDWRQDEQNAQVMQQPTVPVKMRETEARTFREFERATLKLLQNYHVQPN